MSHRLNKTLYQIKVHVGKKCQMKFFTMEKIDIFFFLELELHLLVLKISECKPRDSICWGLEGIGSNISI